MQQEQQDDNNKTLNQLKELYKQQKYYMKCQQEQFKQLENKYDQSNKRINELELQLNNQTQLCVSLLQDLQGLEYLVNQMKQLIPNQQVIKLINQIQETYDKIRQGNEQQIYNKLLNALDKKLCEIIITTHNNQ